MNTLVSRRYEAPVPFRFFLDLKASLAAFIKAYQEVKAETMNRIIAQKQDLSSELRLLDSE